LNLLATLFIKVDNMFTYNNLYYMRYMPVGYAILPMYDQFPLWIPLEIRGNIALGVNMHWIPGPLRQKTIQLIIEMRNKCINERMFRLYYNLIKFNPNLQFMKIAIRKYYMSHCSNIKIISPDQWDSLVFTAHTLYKARYMQKSGYNPSQHIFKRGRALNPQVNARPPKPQTQQQAPLATGQQAGQQPDATQQTGQQGVQTQPNQPQAGMIGNTPTPQ
jgi:hypothetical protein